MGKVVHVLYDKILSNLVWILGTVMITSILMQIFGRSVLRVTWPWTDEVARFSFIYFCFLGGAITLRQKMHIGVDFFEGKMPRKMQFFNRAFVYLVIIAFGLFMGILGNRLMGVLGGQLTPILRIPMRQIYMAIPIAGFLYAFLGAYQLHCHIMGKPYTPAFQDTAKDVEIGAKVLEGKK